MENLLHNKIFGFCQRKKNKLLFSKRFVSNILCPKNKKNFSENFLLKKQVLTRLVYKKKKKNKTFIYKASTQMTKLCSFCLRQTLPMGKNKTENTCLWKKKQRFFVLSFSEFQNEGSKKQTNEVRSFFSFCQDNNVVVQDNETFFCFTIVQNQQAFGNCLWLKKKATLFSCLRS